MKSISLSFLLTVVFFNCYAQDLLPFRIDTLWGYRNKNGAVVIEPQFQYARKFVGDIAVVAKNDKLGAIDRNNRQIVSFSYEYLRPLDSAEFIFGYRAKYFGEHIMGVMTKDEVVKIPAEYSYIKKYRNAYLVTKKKDSVIGKSGSLDIRSVSGTSGLCDSTGKIIIPCKYFSVGWETDTILSVDSAFSTGNGKYISTQSALFTNQGKQLTGFDYKVFGKFIEGVAKARIGDKFGFIYPTGKVAIPIEFDYCENFSNGYAMVKQQEKWGAVDKTGKVVIALAFPYEEVKAMLQDKYSK